MRQQFFFKKKHKVPQPRAVARVARATFFSRPSVYREFRTVATFVRTKAGNSAPLLGLRAFCRLPRVRASILIIGELNGLQIVDLAGAILPRFNGLSIHFFVF